MFVGKCKILLKWNKKMGFKFFMLLFVKYSLCRGNREIQYL